MAARIALFDLGGVLLDWSPARLYDGLFEDPAERDRFLNEICTLEWHEAHDRGVPFEENAAALITRFPGYETQIRAWQTGWARMFDGYIEGTDRLVEMLWARGVPLYAVSNMPAQVWPLMLDMFPLLKRFSDIVISGRIGVTKPEPAIFDFTRTRMGDPDPQDVLFIDDLARNIATADALGYRTHLFRGAPGLETELIRQGLI